MAKHGKKHRAALATVDRSKRYTFHEAVQLATESTFTKFDESLDIAVRLGVDPRHADQMVRGTVVLPNGLGKTVRVLVFAKGEKVKEALDAGADYAGGDELVDKIKEGWLDFDKTVATPDMMGTVGKIGKVLGPRGLMPNAKIGTVTFDLVKVVKEIKAGKVDFRVEKTGIVHAPMGKVSFGQEKLIQNISAFMDTHHPVETGSGQRHLFAGYRHFHDHGAGNSDRSPGRESDHGIVPRQGDFVGENMQTLPFGFQLSETVGTSERCLKTPSRLGNLPRWVKDRIRLTDSHRPILCCPCLERDHRIKSKAHRQKKGG